NAKSHNKDNRSFMSGMSTSWAMRGLGCAPARATGLFDARRSICGPFRKVAPKRPGLHLPLPGAASQAPQSARRKDEGEESDHAERDECPNEEERSARVGDATAGAHTLPAHVDDGDAQRKERQEEIDDVPRSPFDEHQRCVQPNDQDWHNREV